jgi:FeS assembly SUF system protein
MSDYPVVPLQPSETAGAPAPALQSAELIADPERTAALKPLIVEAISKVFDPEIPVNIYELGLIYDIIVDKDNVVGVRMTLTAPACPSAQSLPLEVKSRVSEVPGVSDAKVDVVWEPPWDRDRMSEAAKLQLGMF